MPIIIPSASGEATAASDIVLQVTKRCAKCGQTKPLGEFYGATRGGTRGSCKECTRATNAKWRAANRERHQASQVAWRKANPERQLAATKAWQQANRERFLAGQRARNNANVERQREAVRAWRQANPEMARAFNSRRRAREANAFVEDVLPLVVLERDDGVCGICGEDVDPTCFHVDHIVPLARGGEHSYANTQTAHPHCNMSKNVRLPHEMAA